MREEEEEKEEEEKEEEEEEEGIGKAEYKPKQVCARSLTRCSYLPSQCKPMGSWPNHLRDSIAKDLKSCHCATFPVILVR